MSKMSMNAYEESLKKYLNQKDKEEDETTFPVILIIIIASIMLLAIIIIITKFCCYYIFKKLRSMDLNSSYNSNDVYDDLPPRYPGS